ncbi:Inner-membrane translocator [uncultured Eubacteriales bacterium]|uniref:Inner-membrane translocator n=1 Tax=uncultured Eubacteriales bacterium TaxID=172733 RepID=A0A212KGF8_9FIRM|nr:Inner-membrane translocator [uncultured Eubacteriales bacterium]
MSSLFAAIFSADFLFSVIRVTTPLLFAALAALVCNRGGCLHIAFEGCMLTAAFCGVVGSAYSQNLFVGLLAGLAGGVSIMLLLGYFNLVLNANVVLTGIALNTFASGGTVFMLYVLVNDKGLSTSLPSLTFPNIEIPVIKDIPILGTILSGHNVLTYLSFVCVIVVWLLVFKTALGLRIRTVGENPNAAASVGINVVKTKFTTLIISGVIASFGGIYMSMGYLSWFARDMVAGRGFMGIAAQNLGGAAPLPTFLAALAFGVANALSNVLQTLNVPAEAVQALPYIATLIGLAAYSSSVRRKKNRMKHGKIAKAEQG